MNKQEEREGDATLKIEFAFEGGTVGDPDELWLQIAQAAADALTGVELAVDDGKVRIICASADLHDGKFHLEGGKV